MISPPPELLNDGLPLPTHAIRRVTTLGRPTRVGRMTAEPEPCIDQTSFAVLHGTVGGADGVEGVVDVRLARAVALGVAVAKCGTVANGAEPTGWAVEHAVNVIAVTRSKPTRRIISARARSTEAGTAPARFPTC